MNPTKRYASATDRNRAPILDVLRRVLPDTGRVLEIASGTGQHAVYFSEQLPSLRWQPTDPSEDALESIEAWRIESGLANLEPPIRIDVTEPWRIDSADAVFCANMIHIAPWQCTLALLDGAARLLPVGGPLVLYGPFRREGRHTAPSNEAFDASLRARDGAWGVRDLEVVQEEASLRALQLDEIVQMPANNLTVVLRRR